MTRSLLEEGLRFPVNFLSEYLCGLLNNMLKSSFKARNRNVLMIKVPYKAVEMPLQWVL
jgi:hypothetical protein